MDNLVTGLKEIVKDPVEFTGITLPSAGLVVVLFAYKEKITPALKDLPDPLSGNTFGVLLFLVVTLVVSLILKRVSHDVLNWIYDRCYRDRKRRGADTWFRRGQDAGLLTKEPLLSTYEDALNALRKSASPVVEKVDSLQKQSKLARSTSLILFLFAVILVAKSNFSLAVVCVVLSVLMLYSFFDTRWAASELVYQARQQERAEQVQQ